MPKKYNIMTFSDVPLPSYERPYRGVLLIDYAPPESIDNVYVVSPESNQSFKNKEIKAHFLHFKAGVFKQEQYNFFPRVLRFFKLLFKLISFRLKKHKIDFVYCGTTYLSFLFSLIFPKNLPCFACICDFYFELYGEFRMPLSKLLRPVIRAVEKRGIRRAKLVFVDTKAQRNFMGENFGLERRKCVVLPNGLEVKYFPYKEEKDRELLSHYGFTEKDKIIFYGGDISPQDGIPLIIGFVKENADVKALVIGKGNEEYLNELRKKIKEYGIEKRFVLDSFKPYQELYRYISLADVCLAPFKITATSATVECAKIIIYLFLGKQVLATNAPGIKSLYKNNISYFEEGVFDEKLNELLANPITTEKKKELRILAEKFDFEKIMNHEYKIIEEYFKNPNQDFSQYDYI